METIVAGCTDIINRQKKLQESMGNHLENYKKLLEDTKENIRKEPAMAQQHMKALQEKASKLQFHRDQKDFQSTLSKFGKEIERRFKQDISVIYHPEVFAGKEPLIRRALAVHFIRQGQFDLCDVFVHETAMDEADEFHNVILRVKDEFQQMFTIIKEIEAQQLDNAIEWAQTHRATLIKNGSCLEFNLHRLRFIQLLTRRQTLEAIAYSRKYFGPFGDRHFSDIKRLLTSTIYPDIATSPYADLCSQAAWKDIREEFQRDFCSLLHMSADSLLYTSLLVGTTALPDFIKLHKIMSVKKTEWSQQDELPIEIPLDDDLRFHSVFACPVSREQATEENPPMMMACGHVICKESLASVSRNSRYGRNATRFKCPYCPSESSVDQAKQVYF